MSSRSLASSGLILSAAVKQGSVAAILPHVAQSELPARQYERIESPLLKELRRTMVLAYNWRVFLTRRIIFPTIPNSNPQFAAPCKIRGFD